MSKRKSEFFIVDIFVSILKIEEYIKNTHSSEELKYDCKTWDAVIRELEIIGEATKILIDQNIFNSDKRNIVDFRNVIAHHYFGIDEEIVWDILTTKLPIYKAEVKSLIKKFPDRDAILNNFIQDNNRIDFLVKQLKKLKGNQ